MIRALAVARKRGVRAPRVSGDDPPVDPAACTIVLAAAGSVTHLPPGLAVVIDAPAVYDPEYVAGLLQLLPVTKPTLQVPPVLFHQ